MIYVISPAFILVQIKPCKFNAMSGGSDLMKTESREYYEARERAERLAAENAASAEAREAHDELARAYGQLARAADHDEERPAA